MFAPDFLQQAIHPSQIDMIQTGFSPSPQGEGEVGAYTDQLLEIDRASRIKISYELNSAKGTGAYGLDGEMIDAPMYKQVSFSRRRAVAKAPIGITDALQIQDIE
jgi:citrate lyase subunit beta-like protein